MVVGGEMTDRRMKLKAVWTEHSSSGSMGERVGECRSPGAAGEGRRTNGAGGRVGVGLFGESESDDEDDEDGASDPAFSSPTKTMDEAGELVGDVSDGIGIAQRSGELSRISRCHCLILS